MRGADIFTLLRFFAGREHFEVKSDEFADVEPYVACKRVSVEEFNEYCTDERGQFFVIKILSFIQYINCHCTHHMQSRLLINKLISFGLDDVFLSVVYSILRQACPKRTLP